MELERHVIQYGLQIVSGGFDDAEKVALAAGIDVSHLHTPAAHEEAYTHILLYAVPKGYAKGYERLITPCRDTDVLLLLLVFAHLLSPE